MKDLRLLVIGRKRVWGSVGTSGDVKVIMGTLGKKSELGVWRVVDRTQRVWNMFGRKNVNLHQCQAECAQRRSKTSG